MAFLCLVELGLHFPDNGDLKGKRKELQSLKAGLQRKFGAAVAETGHQDLWQRSTLTLALVGPEQGPLAERVDSLQRYVDARLGDLTTWDRKMLTTSDVLDE
jgi:uncharacterized protein YlxP (DUF503 family)